VPVPIRGRTQRRDTLAASFYPEHNQRQARARLQRTLSTLKTALCDGWEATALIDEARAS
jgi:hypothetical protein